MLPTGAPGDAPPCIRQRPFVIADGRHGIPLLVLAPHLGLRWMGNLLCAGLFLKAGSCQPGRLQIRAIRSYERMGGKIRVAIWRVWEEGI